MKLKSLLFSMTCLGVLGLSPVALANVTDGVDAQVKSHAKLYLVDTNNNKIDSVKPAQLDNKMADSLTTDNSKAYWQSSNHQTDYVAIGQIKSGKDVQYVCVKKSDVKSTDEVPGLASYNREANKMTKDKLLKSVKDQDLNSGKLMFN